MTGLTEKRTIDTVTAEIIVIKDNVARTLKQGVIDIGRRLEEAKEMVPQGEWLNYLEGVLLLKRSTAQNYMRIAREFGDGQIALDGMSAAELFGDLGYSQLVPLLGVPEDARREIAESNDLENMSSREIKKIVEDYQKAKDMAELAEKKVLELEKAAEKSAKAAQKEVDRAEEMEAAKQAAEKQARELDGRVKELMEELKNAPIPAECEVVPDEELLARAREQVQAENAAAIAEAQRRAEEASAALAKAKDPAVHQVNFVFGELRGLSERLETAMRTLRAQQPEAAEKFGAAIGGWYNQAAGAFQFEFTEGAKCE